MESEEAIPAGETGGRLSPKQREGANEESEASASKGAHSTYNISFPMSFEIERHEPDHVVVLTLKGRMVLGEPVEMFRAELDQLTAQGKNRVVLDMRGVDYIDSSALGCLVFAHTRIEKSGGAMPMFGLSQRSIQLMVITKLTTVFRLAQTELDAINMCFPDRAVPSFDILNFVEGHKAGKKGGSAE